MNNTGFLLFAGGDYDEKGGAKDLIGFFPSVESAMAEYAAPRPTAYEWGNILCLSSMKIVKIANDELWE